jgi:molecular chaperone HscA
LLEVSAQEVATGVQSRIVIKPSYGLQDNDIERMLRESYSQAAQDKALRSLREKQVEALRHIEALEAALASDGEALLDASEQAELRELMRELQAAAAGEDAACIDALTVALNQSSGEFAARRMDAGIKAALAGHSLDEIG